jgi:HK97 family phage major capsid protein
MKGLIDPVLGDLRQKWEKKHREAEEILNNPETVRSPGMAAKAEKLYEERDKIGEEILDHKHRNEQVASLRQKYNHEDAPSGMPRKQLPFEGKGGYRTTDARRAETFRDDWQETAGTLEFGYDPDNNFRSAVDREAPVRFGEKTWDLLKSFEYKRDFAMYLRKGTMAIGMFHKTLQEGLDDQGGVFAPAEFQARIIGRLPAPTSMRAIVTTITTGRDTIVFPAKQYMQDDVFTTAFRVTWTGEIPYSSNMSQVNDANLLGNNEIPIHTAMMTGSVTRNLIEDGTFPIQAWYESEYAQTVDLTYEDMILNGSTTVALSNGPNSSPKTQPIGIGFGAATGNLENNTLPEVLNSSTAAGIDYGSIVATQGALAPQYEDDNATVWVMQKRSTYVALEKLVDSQNRPLFTTGYNDSGMVERRGRRLLGDRVILSQLMQPISSTTYPIFYGDMRGYFLGQRVGFSIQILDQTAAKQNQIEIVGRVRFGGKPVEPWRIKILKSNQT